MTLKKINFFTYQFSFTNTDIEVLYKYSTQRKTSIQTLLFDLMVQSLDYIDDHTTITTGD